MYAAQDNVTHMLLFRTKNDNVLKGIVDEVSDDVTEEEFLAAYEAGTSEDPHDFLFLDFHPKRGKAYKFRKNYDEYLVLERNGVEQQGGLSSGIDGRPDGLGNKKAKRSAGRPDNGNLRKGGQIPSGISVSVS